ncbi:unnamed protein product [Acanthoscelides obtectus]|uniref:Uncharacterized protein n=1 Tax=Acanthoscelides obtectus TaxID=200917 RepID=A0A9P0KSE1_ACAOB|nr:unnamed protein product [Acanthoscelides obtectus]CAK1628652.1 hypothetical protein AOBTE_LOCUS5328 [Acanthoscelides obtectus]
MRGRHVPSNKTSQEDKQVIMNHIESFPLSESHYCRKSSQRKYLDAKLSIAKMYSLYKELCQKDSRNPKSMTTYKRIFCLEDNYSFFKPRKDQCAVCMKYQSANADQKAALELSYSEHSVRLTLLFPNKKIKTEQPETPHLLLRHLISKVYCRFQVAMCHQCIIVENFMLTISLFTKVPHPVMHTVIPGRKSMEEEAV